MATVYLAEDLKHHRKVAIKVLRPELAAVLGADSRRDSPRRGVFGAQVRNAIHDVQGVSTSVAVGLCCAGILAFCRYGESLTH